jgi:RNA polymerase sigma factor (sigma-70 family)
VTDEELYEKYSGYAHAIAFKMRRSYRLSQEDAEDIASSALAFLLIQRKKVDFTKHENVVDRFCSLVIINAARNALLHVRKHGVTISLDEPIDGEDGNELHEIIPDDRADTVQALIARDYLNKRWHKLKPEYQVLITRRFGLDGAEPQNQAEIAAEIGVTKAAIGKQLKKALAKLRGTNLTCGKGSSA